MPVKLGVLGFAHGHVFAYGGKWAEDPSLGIEFTKGWDWDPVRKADGCAKLKMEEAANADEVLRSSDAVVISAETAFHAKLVELAGHNTLTAAVVENRDNIVFAVIAVTVLQ